MLSLRHREDVELVRKKQFKYCLDLVGALLVFAWRTQLLSPQTLKVCSAPACLGKVGKTGAEDGAGSRRKVFLKVVR